MRAALLLLIAVPLLCPAAETVTLAVTDFQALGVFPDQAQAVAEIIRTELVGLPGVRVIERSRLNAVLEERSLSMTGLTTDEAAKVGVLTGADYVAVGSLSALGSTYTVSLRLVDVRSSEAVLGETQTVGDAGELPWVCRALAMSLAKSMGRPAEEVTIIPLPGVERPRVLDLLFYAHGQYDTPLTSFSHEETAMIVWSLELERGETTLPRSFPVTVVWLTPEGDTRWEEVRFAEFEGGQTRRRVIGGKGFTEPGSWTPGDWTVRVLLEEDEVLSRGFTVE